MRRRSSRRRKMPLSRCHLPSLSRSMFKESWKKWGGLHKCDLKNEEKQVFTWKESFSSLSDLGLGEICWAGDNLNIREEPFDVGEGLSILEQFSMTYELEEMGLTGLNTEHQTNETWPVLGSNFKGVKWGKASLTRFLIGIWSSMRLANHLI